MRKSLVAIAAACSSLLILGGCSTESETAEPAAPAASGSAAAAGGQTTTTCAAGDRIGVSLPAQTSENWTLAKEEFDAGLTAAGFTPDVQFSDAASAAASQQTKIDNMLTQGSKVIVIGAEDGVGLAGDEPQAGVALQHRFLGREHPVHLEVVVHERQRHDPGLIGKLRRASDLGPDGRRPAGKCEPDQMQCQVHGASTVTVCWRLYLPDCRRPRVQR